MRVAFLPLCLLPIALLGCPDSAPDVSTKAEVDIVERFVAAGIWVGKSADGSACTVFVTHGTGPAPQIEVATSLDKENVVDGVALPAKERTVLSRFSLEVFNTDTQQFSVDETNADVVTTEDAAGRTMHLRAHKSGQGFAFVEIEETIRRASITRRCEDVVLDAP
jgi:hypothetical protein